MATPLDRSLNLLHRDFAAELTGFLEHMRTLGYPFEVYESFRSASRQDARYSLGRTRPGEILTAHTGWNSFHQYGLAVDLGLHEHGQWSWNMRNNPLPWNDLVDWAPAFGLEAEPGGHIQASGFTIEQLRRGCLPGCGQIEWMQNLRSQSDHTSKPPFLCEDSSTHDIERGGVSVGGTL